MDNHLVITLEQVADLFSNNKEKEGYVLLLQVISKLEILSRSIIEKEGNNPLLSSLQTLMEAMENKDIWTMSDVIQYELIPMIQQLA